MGLLLNVYRTDRADLFARRSLEGPFEPTDDRPAVMLVNGPGLQFGPNPVIVPAVRNDAGEWERAPGWWAHGGNYASGDSRYSRAVEGLGGCASQAVAIHDRIEVPDREVTAIDANGVAVVVGYVRRRGMRWIALGPNGVTFEHHGMIGEFTSETTAREAVAAYAGVRS